MNLLVMTTFFLSLVVVEETRFFSNNFIINAILKFKLQICVSILLKFIILFYYSLNLFIIYRCIIKLLINMKFFLADGKLIENFKKPEIIHETRNRAYIRGSNNRVRVYQAVAHTANVPVVRPVPRNNANAGAIRRAPRRNAVGARVVSPAGSNRNANVVSQEPNSRNANDVRRVHQNNTNRVHVYQAVERVNAHTANVLIRPVVRPVSRNNANAGAVRRAPRRNVVGARVVSPVGNNRNANVVSQGPSSRCLRFQARIQQKAITDQAAQISGNDAAHQNRANQNHHQLQGM